MNVWVPDAPPTWGTLLMPILPPVPLLPALGVIMAVLYLLGVIRLRRQKRRWPLARTLCFLLGCVSLIAVTGLAVERYGYALLSVFMFQQLTLLIAIPPLLVLGSPGTLLLRATPHRGLGLIVLRLALRGLRSRAAAWALSPWVATPLFLMSFYGLYLAGFADPILQMPGGHTLLEMAFLASGVLFTVPILSSDPLPVRMTYPGRGLDLFIEAALHAFFGVFLMMSPTLFVEHFAESTRALGIDPLADQWLAGALAWSYGEGPSLLMLLYVVHRWFRDDTARATKADQYADAHGDPELDAYNDYLRALREKDT